MEQKKTCIVIPDSFKGTLSAQAVCAQMAHAIKARYPGATVHSIPIADGGEGSVDCFLHALGGEKIEVPAHNPLHEPMQAFYGRIKGGETAVVEMAAAAGLPLLEGRLRPLEASTFGVGELLLHAAQHGAKTLIVGLGGSATTDGGCGAAAAAGVRFFNAAGEAFIPSGGTLETIARIDMSGLHKALRQTNIIAMCDIDNPLYGPQGAAHVFAPQKGASSGQVAALDAGLAHLSRIIERDVQANVAGMPGAGAAGGMGAGMVAFFGAQLAMGIEVLLDAVGFDALLQRADVVFTGEGKLDGQSLRGKAVIGVARRAKRAGVPVVAVVGAIGEGAQQAYAQGVSAVFSINPAPVPFEEAKAHSEQNLQNAMDNILRLMQCVEKGG